MKKDSVNNQALQQLEKILAKEVHSFSAEQDQLNNALRLLSKWRSVLIQNTLLREQGTKVMQGPLSGLDFLNESAEGCHIAKLLGCYEQPLQPFIELAINKKYSQILNVGCAEGYYAVGLAMRMPSTKVMAYDINLNAQRVCSELAKKNSVSDRVLISGLFTLDNLTSLDASSTLILCDIEGAEKELLDPQKSSALKFVDIIVESHECLIPGVTQLLINRFNESHEISLVRDNGQRSLETPPQWFTNLAHLDQLLATWEWRSGPTPWLVMNSKHPIV